MKHKYLFSALFFLFSAFNLFAQKTFVPDDNFEQALIDLGFDSGELNDSVPTININSVISLNISGKNISSLIGIEGFALLTELYCGNNQLTNLDISSNTSLELLSCFNNNLHSLNLGANGNLTDLICYNNILTTLDLSAIPVLTKLICSNNQFTNLDLSSNSLLAYINCNNNALVSLNLKNGNNGNLTGGTSWETGITTTNNPHLYCIQVDNLDNAYSYYTWHKDAWSEYNVDCSSFKPVMTYVPDDNFEQTLIDLGYDSGLPDDSVPSTSITKIESLNIQYRNIKDLTGIEGFKVLKSLSCNNNQLSSINLSKNKNLASLYCNNNQLTSLNLSSNTALKSLNCSYNNLIDLDLSSNSNLYNLTCYYNQLSGLNLRNGNNNILNIDVQHNPNLFCIQVDNSVAAYSKTYWYKPSYTAYSENCSTKRIEMTYVPDDNFEKALINLGLDFGTVNDSVPKESIKKLKSLNITSKNISDLTGIEAFVSLEQLFCYNNQISELKLNSLSKLHVLHCHNNKITNLDLSANYLLTDFSASSNQLTGINLRNGNNSNMRVNLSYNPDLICIQVDDPVASYKNTNWYKSAYASYTEDCSTYRIKMTYVPDDNFEQALKDLGLDFGSLNDSVITESIKHLKSLNIDSKNISDLTGIVDFTDLEQLYCNWNMISEIHLNANKNLKTLSCNGNKISDLDLSSNSLLTYLDGRNNRMSGLNLRNGNNSNMTMDVTNNPELFCIQVDDQDASNSFSKWYKNGYARFSEDCSASFDLKMTYVPDDNFERALIDLKLDNGLLNDSVPTFAIENLKSLSVNNRNIFDLTGIEAFSALEVLNCYTNQITELYLHQNKNLKILQCQNNELAGLDLSSNVLLTELNCSTNVLSDLDLSSTKLLTNLEARNNRLTGLNLQNGNNINMQINVWANPHLYCIQVDDPVASYENFKWFKNDVAIYSEDCSAGYVMQMTYVPDDNFEQFLIDIGLDFGMLNDSVPTAAIEKLVMLNINNKNISDLTGIEDFLGLKQLYCNDNQLSELNLQNNKYLNILQCQNNMISNLDLASNGSLTKLYCSKNNLINLDLRFNPDLNYLDIRNNPLFGLNIQNGRNYNLSLIAISNPNLLCIQVDDPIASGNNSNWYKDKMASYSINCSNYKIGMTYVPDDNFEQALIDFGYDSGELNDSVPTAKISSISTLNIPEKNIASLEGIQDFAALTDLICYNNKISSLDLSANKNLQSLRCFYNNVEFLDLSKNTNLKYLECQHNKLIALNLQNEKNTHLETADLRYNQSLYCIQVANASLVESNPNWHKDDLARYSEDCSNYKVQMTYVPDDNFEQALIDLGYDSGELNDSVSSTEIWGITNLDLHSRNISNLQGIEDFVNLVALDCSVNLIEQLNLQKNTHLLNLNCAYNSLTSLNLNSKLETLDCFSNQLTTLDLTSNLGLTYLHCSKNQLSTLNIDFNINLAHLYCYNNQLTDLDLTSNRNLVGLHCGNNRLTSLDLSSNPNLNTIFCYNNNLLALNLQNGNNQMINEFSALNNPELSCIKVDNAVEAESYTNMQKDEQAGYSEDCKSENTKIPVFEYDALLAIFNALDGANWNHNENWLTTQNYVINDWYGITVENHHVTSIVLNSNNLTGDIPPEIGNLQKLNNLELNANKVTSIPPEIGNLQNLNRLGLSVNSIAGSIPKEIGNLINLEYLWLSGNNLSGNIPVEIGNLESLTFLSLSNNNLSGSILNEIGNLEMLYALYCDANSFTGFIPTEIGNIANLQIVNLSNNHLKGPIPTSIEKLEKLEYLNLANNKYTFADLEPSVNKLDSIHEFIYAPQAIIGAMNDTTIYKNQSVTFRPQNYNPGEFDRFLWSKNGSEIHGANELTYTISNSVLQDSGFYNRRVTNSLFPDLTLYSDTIWLEVLIPVGINEKVQESIRFYPNPATKKIYVETGNRIVDLKVYSLTGTLVLEKNDITSGWLNLDKINSGMYIFRITIGDTAIINQKIELK